jgi:hypothetical protein
MLLVIHISIAILGLLQATFAALLPSRVKLTAVYALSAATLVSGFSLALVLHASIAQSCMSGLVYLAAVGSLSAVAHYRLVRQA